LPNGLSFDHQVMTARRRFMLAWACGLPVVVSGCGWEPLYADRQTGPADAELRAIKVMPIAERIGQKLELALRSSLNPTGEPTPQRYVFRATLTLIRSNLGVTTQGLGTRARLDVYANFNLADSKTGSTIFTGTSHVAESFDLQANEYTNVVAENDAGTRSVEELRRDLMTRLTLFMQRRVAQAPAKS
jgi:LPS-assembly lipoprotein